MILHQERQFHAFAPHPGLRNCILYYNLVCPSGDPFPKQYTLMPNACGTLSLAFDGKAVHAELWGASIAPVPLGREPNRYRTLLLIQLSPHGLYQITRQNQAELAGKRLSLAEADRELSKSLLRAFTESESVNGLADACDQVLFGRMEKRVVSEGLLAAAQAITCSRGLLRVREAARLSGYSERQLNRLFLTQIGMNVKSYARYVRFHHVLRRLQQAPGCLAELSQRAGYFDQAHFDKDFKAISGVSPQQYLKTMSDFYYDGTEIYRTMSSKEE